MGSWYSVPYQREIQKSIYLGLETLDSNDTFDKMLRDILLSVGKGSTDSSFQYTFSLSKILHVLVLEEQSQECFRRFLFTLEH